MTLYTLLKISPLLAISLGLLFGACIGSFLNVVIYRLPHMLHQEWQKYQAQEQDDKARTIKFNLASPGSCCPHCQHKIAPWHNIPLFSYLMLRGKCAYCGQNINIQYFLVELFTGILSGGILLYCGLSWSGLGLLLLTWSFIPLALIDLEHQILPDNITLPLLWLGLLFNIFDCYVPLTDAVIGAMTGYVSLWLVMQGYKLFTGKIGMGHGDFKLFAALGAWLGWQILPFILIMSALLGAILGTLYLLSTKQKSQTPIAFGPFLIVVGWCAMIFHPQLIQALGVYFG